jgi:hypothetical protein
MTAGEPLKPPPDIKIAEPAAAMLSDTAATRVADRIRNEKELEATMRAFEKTGQEMAKFKKIVSDRYTPKNGMIDLDTFSKEDRSRYLLMERKLRTARELLELDIADKLPEIRQEYATTAIDTIDRDIATKMLGKDFRIVRIAAAQAAAAASMLDKGFPQNLQPNSSTMLTAAAPASTAPAAPKSAVTAPSS